MPGLARPSALERFDAIRARFEAALQPVAVFIDYDGTLVPIAARPELAVMPASTRDLVSRLACACPVGVVTGRGLDDIVGLVGLDEVYYAASHGFDIAGPGVRHQPDPELAETIDEVAAELQPVVESVDGAVMESKRFSIAVHWRLVDPDDVGTLEQAIDTALETRPKFKKGSGKKIFEIRPAMAWHKGAAVDWILEHLSAEGEPRIPIFIGDDHTDEDALRTVEDTGIGIFVGPPPSWETAASYGLADPAEVHTLLQRLLAVLEPS